MKTIKKDAHYQNGGLALAAIPGYHSLLALRSHGKITPEQFERKVKKLKREYVKAQEEKK